MPSFASPFAGFLWNMLCHSLWSVPAIGLIVAFRAEKLPPCRRERRLRWAVGACSVVPCLIAMVQTGFETPSNASTNRFETRTLTASSNHVKEPQSELADIDFERTSTATPSFRISLRNVVRQSAPWIIFAWSAGIFVLIGRLLLGSIVFRFRFASRPATPELQSIANVLARRLDMKRSPVVRISNAASQPMVVGLLRPAVILPEYWPYEIDAQQTEAVLAHEIAHLQRADLRNRIFDHAAATVWFFHPAMHRLIRKAAMWREIAADRLAVDATGNPLALARALESFALQASVRHSKPALGLPLLASRMPSHLVTRVGSILGTEDSRISKPERRLRWAIRAFVVLLAAFAVLLVRSQPFGETSKFRPAMPIGGKTTMAVGSADATKRQIRYEIRLVNVDSFFAGETLRNNLRLVPGQILPEQLVIGQDLVTKLVSHPSASILQFPRVTAYENAEAMCRWESPNLPKIATIEQNGRTVPEKIKKETVWTEIRLTGEASQEGLELRSEIKDFNDRLKPSKTPVYDPSTVVAGPARYLLSVTEELELNGTAKLKPGESLCVRLGQSMETYRKEPRFLYESLLGEKGSRVSQFLRLAIVTASEVDPETGESVR